MEDAGSGVIEDVSFHHGIEDTIAEGGAGMQGSAEGKLAEDVEPGREFYGVKMVGDVIAFFVIVIVIVRVLRRG